MKSPDEIDALSEQDLAVVEEILGQMQTWFEEGHETYQVNWVVNQAKENGPPEKVWRETVRKARSSGWDASIRGAMVSVQRPRP